MDPHMQTARTNPTPRARTGNAPAEPHVRMGIIGAGAMGLSLAAMLGQRFPVTIVVRHPLQAHSIEADGVRVTGLMHAQSHPRIVRCISCLPDAAPLHAVFVATKTTAIDDVAEELRPILPSLAGPDGQPIIVSFQNGIEPGRTLLHRLGNARVLRMVLNYGATRIGHNEAEVMLASRPHYIGGPDATFVRDATPLAAALSSSGLETIPVENIEPYVWRKGILNAAMNPVAALTDGSVGEVLDSPARSIVARLMHEGLAVAAADRIDLGPDIERRMWEILDAARPHTPSMVGDIRSGRPSEIGQLNRQIIDHATRVGVPVPTHELIASLIDAFDWRVFHRTNAPASPMNRPGYSRTA